MDISKSIKKFRLEKGLKQTDIAVAKFSSTYSRIERGERSVKFDDLQLIIDALGISEYEFFSYSFLSDSKQNFTKKIRLASSKPEDEMLKSHMIDTYFVESYRFSNSSKELSYYYSLKSHFQLKWGFQPLNESELSHIFNHLISQKYYGYYEYHLFANTIHLFDPTRIKQIILCLLPIKEEELRDHDTKKYAYSGLINAISELMYERNYEDVKELIKIAEMIDVNNTNYYFRFSVQYFKNIIEYINTRDMLYLNKIYNFIDLVKNIGDIEMAERMNKEATELIINNEKIDKNDIGISLIKDQ